MSGTLKHLPVVGAVREPPKARTSVCFVPNRVSPIWTHAKKGSTVDIEELVDNLELLEDWEERYRYLIELGRKLPPLPEEQHTEQNKVRGCMSQVWMLPQVDEHTTPPTLHFLADSDAHIVKGLIAVLMTVYSGKTADAILAIDINEVFTRMGLEQHISPNRRNGFFSMVGRIQDIARASLAAAPTA